MSWMEDPVIPLKWSKIGDTYNGLVSRPLTALFWAWDAFGLSLARSVLNMASTEHRLGSAFAGLGLRGCVLSILGVTLLACALMVIWRILYGLGCTGNGVGWK
jgi:hypothetical protein